VVIVITDGESRQKKLTASQADKLHQAGVEVIAIGELVISNYITYTTPCTFIW
jgi:hypothetical protein